MHGTTCTSKLLFECLLHGGRFVGDNHVSLVLPVMLIRNRPLCSRACTEERVIMQSSCALLQASVSDERWEAAAGEAAQARAAAMASQNAARHMDAQRAQVSNGCVPQLCNATFEQVAVRNIEMLRLRSKFGSCRQTFPCCSAHQGLPYVWQLPPAFT